MEHVRGFFAADGADELKAVGASQQRSDIAGHVTGRTQFYADRHPHGLLHLKMVRSSHHHARIKSIDTAAALSSPGVVRILCHADVPANIYTILRLIQVEPNDEPVLAIDKVRFKGEPVLAVVAESEAAARAAVAKVKVEYEELPAVFDVEEALAPGAPLVNEYHGHNYFTYEGHPFRRVRYGDVEKAFAAAIALVVLEVDDVDKGCALAQAGSDAPADAALLDALRRRRWAGNVRELANTVQRAVLLGPSALSDDSEQQEMLDEPYKVGKARAIEAFERRYLEELLTRHNGNVAEAARSGNLDPAWIFRLVKRYAIDVQSMRRR